MPGCGELGPGGIQRSSHSLLLSLGNVATTGVTKYQPCLLETYQLYSEETIQADRLEEKQDIWTELSCFALSFPGKTLWGHGQLVQVRKVHLEWKGSPVNGCR